MALEFIPAETGVTIKFTKKHSVYVTECKDEILEIIEKAFDFGFAEGYETAKAKAVAFTDSWQDEDEYE